MGKAIAWFAGGVVVACIAALAAFYVLDLEVVDRDAPPEVSTSTVTTTTAAQVTVPDVVGLTISDARAEILSAGLSPLGDSGGGLSEYSYVKSQSPPAGTQVDEGSGVTIRR